tara:strand:+ start:406 stop:924 length:519 start_codon:yes stop_codon:yes gene_type:complete
MVTRERALKKGENVLLREISKTKDKNIKSLFNIDCSNLKITIEEIDYSNFTQKLTYEYIFDNNIYVLKNSNVTKYQLIDIGKYSFESIVLTIEIKYSNNYPFDPPQYTILSIKNNTKYDCEKQFYSMIKYFNKLYHDYCCWSPITRMEKDILSFTVSYLVFISRHFEDIKTI